MPIARQALITYPGIRDIISASYSMTPGISPNVLIMVVLPQPGVFRQGNVTMQWGSSTIRLYDCIVDKVAESVSNDGKKQWVLTILDRRWKWRDTGRISGRYNIRRAGSAEIDEKSKRTPRELAALCFKAMKVSRFNTQKMPNSTFPEIDWDYENPSEALQALCEDQRCVIVLRIDNVVEIYPINVGLQMPNISGVTKHSETIDPSERPDSITIVGAPTKYQTELRLVPIAEAAGGNLVPLNDVHYAPLGGGFEVDFPTLGPQPWAYSALDHLIVEAEDDIRELAEKTVFKWYRIYDDIKLPGIEKRIKDRSRVLPLLEEQIELVEVDGRLGPREPVVYGIWEGQQPTQLNNPHPDLEAFPNQIYPYDYEIDLVNGIVKFANPVYRIRQFQQGFPPVARDALLPAKLVLRTSHHLRNEDTGAWERPEFNAALPGRKLNTNPAYSIHPDVRIEVYKDNQDNLKTNLKDAQKTALSYLRSERQRYVEKSPLQAEYVGLIPWSCTGAIKQIAWSIGDSGATTQINRQIEQRSVSITTVERRAIERQRRADRIALRQDGPELARDLRRADG